MNKNDLNERLDLLRSTDTITQKAAEVTEKTFDHLVSVIGKHDIVQGEMLFTHLSSAITRLERGENIEGPPQEVLNEVKDAGYTEKADQEIAFIQKQYGKPLPNEEINYLHLHYATIFQQNEGGNEKNK